MRIVAIHVSALAIGATALLAVPAIVPSEAKAAGRHMHHKPMKLHHRWRHHYGSTGYIAPAQPYAGSYGQPGPICPTVGHSFHCKIWPPPYEDQ